MFDEHPKGTIPTKQTNNQSNLREIFLGIGLFIGMNFVLLVARDPLYHFLSRIDSIFFGNEFFDIRIFDIVIFSSIFLINITIFIYLIIRRPLMVIGILAGIPMLMLLLVLLWFALALIVIVLWFVAILLHSIGLI
jgi:hypothetical protein